VTEHEPTISEAVDAIYRQKRGLDAPSEQLTAEEVEAARRAAENAAFERMETAAERRAEGERVARIHRALANHVGTLKHGAVYTQADKKAAVAAIVDELGGDVSDETRKAIRSFVTEAATNIRSGDKVTPTRRTYDVAEQLANTTDELGGRKAADPADDVEDPAELAAMIGRG
jgi:hypothetical protein